MAPTRESIPHNAKRPRAEADSGSSRSVYLDKVQCASHALEIYSHGGLRSHVIGALITDGDIEFLYYDRSIVIASTPFPFLEQMPHFIAILAALRRFKDSQWGYALPPIIPQPNSPLTKHMFSGTSLELKNGVVLALGQTVFHQHGLIGRGTCVLRAKCLKKPPNAAEEWDENLIVKLSWPSKKRLPEPDIIAAIRQGAVEANEARFLNHLPNVLHSEDRESNQLSPELIAQLGDKYDECVFRIIVSDELFPITQRNNAVDLALSFAEIVECEFVFADAW